MHTSTPPSRWPNHQYFSSRVSFSFLKSSQNSSNWPSVKLVLCRLTTILCLCLCTSYIHYKSRVDTSKWTQVMTCKTSHYFCAYFWTQSLMPLRAQFWAWAAVVYLLFCTLIKAIGQGSLFESHWHFYKFQTTGWALLSVVKLICRTTHSR